MPNRTLTLLYESPLHQLFGLPPDTRMEASGVRVRDALALVVFDNMPNVGVVDLRLQTGPTNRLVGMYGPTRGFEDVVHDAETGLYYLLIESAVDGDGRIRPMVECYDAKGALVEALWCEFDLEAENKGFEGLAFVRWGGEELLLGLCEGNKCCGGAKGRKGGGGRIQVFRRGAGIWAHAGTVKLPKSLAFADYASLDVRDGWVAVLSQEASAIWIGRFADEGWTIRDDGVVFDLPRDAEGEIVYCNAEGLSWIADRKLMIVSDRRKQGKQPKRCCLKEMSAHVFAVPE
jgi:hypothetical protein